MRLTPEQAALAAHSVYRIINNKRVGLFDPFLLDNFDISTGSRFEGSAGALFMKYDSGFGIIAQGKENPRTKQTLFPDDVLILTRGTDIEKILQDLVLTDGNVGIQFSPSNHVVHAGFNKVFNSFEKDLSKFFHGKKQPARVHCVGHSLGGALATLAANWVKCNTKSKPILYTFGSPRVGASPFAKYITDSLAPENIHRVYHQTDIVSMVPIWPFTHVPAPSYGSDYFIESPGMPNITYHSMEENSVGYLPSVRGKSWGDLRRSPPPTGMEKGVDAWLASNGPLSLTYNTVSMIGTSIVYLVKKILKVTGIAIQGTASVGLTVLDVLAWAAEKAVAASKEVGIFVGRLMRRIMSALGMAVSSTQNMTSTFIRWVLQQLQAQLYRLAGNAIRLVHRR